MSHITIIISKPAPTVTDSQSVSETSYEYCMPVPHNATPRQVGKMVESAYRHLEGDLVSGKTEAGQEE